MTEAPRYAVYYAPAETDPLWAAGAAWLGRDPAGRAAPVPRPETAGLEEITEAPRRYGFHATLKPPMRLHPEVTRADLLQALRAVATSVLPFALPSLAVTDFQGFLCLRETQPSAALQAYADAMVAGLDHLRAPLSARELAHRRAAGLCPAREANLVRWGYPDVFATWFFHMTLSRRLDAAEQARIRPQAQAWFAQALAEPRGVRDVCLFEQSGRGEPFLLAARFALGGVRDPRGEEAPPP